MARIGIIAAFLSALYLVEAGPWGSRSVAAYNNGYGTFDMKAYDAEVVYSILPTYSTEGFHVATMYYLCDYLFIAAFLCFQIMLSQLVYHKVKSPIPRILLNGAAVIRALMDGVENAMLAYVIMDYPAVHKGAVMAASYCTQVKLCMIPIWGAALMSGILFNYISFDFLRGSMRKKA